jgi:hypothetical protein
MAYLNSSCIVVCATWNRYRQRIAQAQPSVRQFLFLGSLVGWLQMRLLAGKRAARQKRFAKGTTVTCYHMQGSSDNEGRRQMATSSFGQIVVLDDDMADRIIESNKTANNHPFGQGSGLFKEATEEDTRKILESWKRAAHDK